MDMPVTYIDDSIEADDRLGVNNSGDTISLEESVRDAKTSRRRTAEMSKAKSEVIMISKEEVAAQMDMPSTPIDWIPEAEPKNGLKAYRLELNELIEVHKEDLFMRGLKSPLKVDVLFKVNQDGVPIEFNVINAPWKDMEGQIEEAMRQSSTWKDAPVGKWISFDLRLTVD